MQSNKIQDKSNENLDKIFHQTVKKVTEDYDALAFNTAISQMMVFVNAVMKEEVFPRVYAEEFLKLVNPIAPFITEEIWENLGHENSIAYEKWPIFDDEKTKENEVEIAVQVNSKIVARMLVSAVANNDEALAQIKQNETIKNLINGKTIVKEIYVPGRIANIIVK